MLSTKILNENNEVDSNGFSEKFHIIIVDDWMGGQRII